MNTPNVFSKRRSTQLARQSQKSLRGAALKSTGSLTVAIASTLTLSGLTLSGAIAESGAAATAQGSIAESALSAPVPISQSEDVYFLALDYDLNRAKNLARQRGEAENGGVSVYETEPSMHGPAADSPHVINTDGSVTFTFRGKPRGGDFYRFETQVTVAYDAQTQWDIVTDYNQEIPPTTVPMSDLL
ncbi:MAG: hypothetical protein WBA57_16480 [Elainellaceae cyanobacterium]